VSEESGPEPGLVVYDCAGIDPGAACAGSAPSDDLLAIPNIVSEIAARHFPPDSSFWERPTRALTAAEGVDPSDALERIALQNAALYLALASAPHEPALSARARRLAKKLAFPAAKHPVTALDIDAWIGPENERIERTPPNLPLMHENVFEDTRMVTLVRTKTLRANFARLVAFDDAGEPFVTNVVGAIEIRRGLEQDARECVLEIDAARLRCKMLGGLAPAPLASLSQSHFLSHDDAGHVRCNSCHQSPDTVINLPLSIGARPNHEKTLLDALRPRLRE
jgi:hypothetical protein